MTHADVRALLATDPDAAVAAARALVAENDGDWAAMILLARGLRAIGQADEAASVDVAAMKAATRDPRHRQAAAALQQGRAIEGNSALKALLDADPDDALAAVMLGIQASRANQLAIADDLLRHAVACVPGDPGARLALADHYARSKRFAAARDELQALPPAVRESDAAMDILATCLGELGDTEAQLDIYRQLAARAPNALTYNVKIGLALRTLGRIDEAAAAFRAVIAAVPDEGTSWQNLANLKGERFTDADIAQMEAGLARPGGPVENRIRLHFALGKALEDRAEPEKAFAHYDAGNRLRASIAPYDPALVGDWIARSERAFTPGFFAAREGWGDPAPDPIFIVGMQRSGSTLIEQILASHPAIEGTAELTELPTLVRDFSEDAARQGRSFEEALALLDPAGVRALGHAYLQAAAAYRRTDRPIFTDKMPNNWMHVPLIRLILPRAKIIDVRREPMDCCFSNWKQLYARGLDHSNALETMGHYYRDYVRLMRHVDRVQPGAVHRVVHDDLVDDSEGEVARLFAYLGLPFDPAVLDFHRTDRAVRTISASQVRKPINRDGVGRWKPFEPWLAPLKTALGETLADWRG